MKVLFCGHTQMAPRYAIYFCDDDEDVEWEVTEHGMNDLLSARDALNKFIEQQKQDKDE